MRAGLIVEASVTEMSEFVGDNFLLSEMVWHLYTRELLPRRLGVPPTYVKRRRFQHGPLKQIGLSDSRDSFIIFRYSGSIKAIARAMVDEFTDHRVYRGVIQMSLPPREFCRFFGERSCSTLSTPHIIYIVI
jgi:hypothetical protein